MCNKDSKILIVDDDSANILLLSKILDMKGYFNVTATVDPCEAIILQKKHGYALVLLDINMPKLNGYEVLKQIRSLDDYSHTKVIATSGDVSEKDIDKALKAGFDYYLRKPMKVADILELVEEALQS